MCFSFHNLLFIESTVSQYRNIFDLRASTPRDIFVQWTQSQSDCTLAETVRIICFAWIFKIFIWSNQGMMVELLPCLHFRVCGRDCVSWNECEDSLLNTRRSYSKKVTRRSFGGLFWPPKRNRYNFWTVANISTKFYRCITYIWSGIWKYVKFFFPRWRPTWPPKFWIECISALLSYTETNKVSIHIKWRS